MKKIALLLLVLQSAVLSASYDCCNPCDDGGCGTPLRCGQWSIVPKIGVAPTIRTAQDPVWLTNPCFETAGSICDGCQNTPRNPATPVSTVSVTAKFQDQFKTPLAAGVELQYAIDEHHMVYLEYAYRHANPKIFPFTAGAFNVCERFTKFQSHAGYIGARHYFDRVWCDRLSFFLGGKMGILHRDQVCYNLNLAIPSAGVPLTEIGNNVYFFKDNVVSAGLHLGLDYCFNCNWSFQFNAGFVASCGPKVNQNVVFAGETDPAKLTALLGLTNVNIGATGTEVQFPVTFGLRFNY